MVVLKAVRLVPQGAIPIVHGTRQATLFQQPQGTIDRGKPNAGIVLFDLLVEFMGGEMSLGGQKDIDNIPPWLRMFQPLLTEKIFKDANLILHSYSGLPG